MYATGLGEFRDGANPFAPEIRFQTVTVPGEGHCRLQARVNRIDVATRVDPYEPEGRNCEGRQPRSADDFDGQIGCAHHAAKPPVVS